MARDDTAEPCRIVLQNELSLVLRKIEVSAREIVKQCEIIAMLEKTGHDTTEALATLANFERVYELNIASHRKIMRELATLGQVSRLR